MLCTKKRETIISRAFDFKTQYMDETLSLLGIHSEPLNSLAGVVFLVS